MRNKIYIEDLPMPKTRKITSEIIEAHSDCGLTKEIRMHSSFMVDGSVRVTYTGWPLGEDYTNEILECGGFMLDNEIWMHVDE